MNALWDTSVASRLHPRGAVIEHVLDRAIAGDPVAVAAPAVLEIAYRFQRQLPANERFGPLLDWFTRTIASDVLAIVPFDGRAALVAGQVRGVAPHPPARRRDPRSKTMRQAAWLVDVQIGATAFAAGLDVATDNRADFEAIAAALAQLYPSAPPLAVAPDPFAA